MSFAPPRWEEVAISSSPFLFSQLILDAIPEPPQSFVKALRLKNNKVTESGDHDGEIQEEWAENFLSSLLYATTKYGTTISLRRREESLEEFREVQA